MRKERQELLSNFDLNENIDKIYDKTLSLLENNSEVIYINTKFLKRSMIDHQFEFKGDNYSLSKSDNRDNNKAVMLYQIIQKGVFSPKNIAEGFIVRKSIQDSNVFSLEIVYSDYYGKPLVNSQEALEKINNFLQRFEK